MPGSKYKIVLVEDSEDDVVLFEATLDRAGLRPSFDMARCFPSAERAIKYFREIFDAAVGTWPDIVILDLKLPGHDGFEVLKAIRTLHPTQVVAVFSTSVLPEDMVRAEVLGVDLFQTKTFEIDAFSRFLRFLAQLAEARQHKRLA